MTTSDAVRRIERGAVRRRSRMLLGAAAAGLLALAGSVAPAMATGEGIHIVEGAADEHGCHALEVWNEDVRVAVIDAYYEPAPEYSGMNCAFNMQSGNLPDGTLLFDWIVPGPTLWQPGYRILYGSDGTTEGTQEMTSFGGFRCDGFGSWGIIGKAAFGISQCFGGSPSVIATQGRAGTTFYLPGKAKGKIMGIPPASGSATTPYNRILYVANHPTKGRELWVSDGTRKGTYVVRDINPGVAGSDPANFHVKARVRFKADDGTGRVWWITNGTRKGTYKAP